MMPPRMPEELVLEAVSRPVRAVGRAWQAFRGYPGEFQAFSVALGAWFAARVALGWSFRFHPEDPEVVSAAIGIAFLVLLAWLGRAGLRYWRSGNGWGNQ